MSTATATPSPNPQKGDEQKEEGNTDEKPNGEESAPKKIFSTKTRRGLIVLGASLFLGSGIWSYTEIDQMRYLVHESEVRAWEKAGKPGPEPALKPHPFSLVGGGMLEIGNYLHLVPVAGALPPMELPPGAPEPLTLVINLEDTLTHTEESLLHGSQTALRPDGRMFLSRLSKLYEVVIFSNGSRIALDEVTAALDPDYTIFSHKLNASHLSKAEVAPGVEGLSKQIATLGRDPAKVILLDKRVDLGQENNTIVLPEWKNDTSDVELLKLLPILERFATEKVKDVREPIEALGGGGLGFADRYYEYNKKMLQKQKEQGAGLKGIFPKFTPRR